jgi:hypothetical protein
VATASALQEDGNALLFTVLSSKGKIYNASSPTTPYIANFDVIGAPWTSEVWTNITASECALWFCVQAYNISIENSRQSQSLVKSWSTIADTEPFDGISNRTFIDIPADFNVSPNATFYVGGESVRAIKEALPQYLEGTVLNGDGYQYSSNYIEALWNASSNMDALVSNLALSITNGMILQQPALSSAPHYGTGYRYLGFVHVRWLWLVFPVTLVLCSSTLLVLSMLQTRQSGAKAWKSSRLFMLFVGLDRDVKHRGAGKMDKKDGLKNAVGDANVVLKREAAEWEFVLA